MCRRTASLRLLWATAHGTLDWARRYKLMRTHTAMHILCGVVWRDYGASVTGGNMDPGKSRMDFRVRLAQPRLDRRIEARCNAEVAAARPTHAQTLPREEAFQIPDLIRTKINLLPEGIAEVHRGDRSTSTCRRTAVRMHNTQEVGAIHIPDYKQGRHQQAHLYRTA